MTTTAITPPSPEEVLPRWLEELQAGDRAKGTIRRYKSAVKGFLAWYSCEEQRPLTFSTLTPIALVGYRNYVQRTQRRATSTVNGQISALRADLAPGSLKSATWRSIRRNASNWLGGLISLLARGSTIPRRMRCCVRPKRLVIGFATTPSSRYSYKPACVWMNAVSSLWTTSNWVNAVDGSRFGRAKAIRHVLFPSMPQHARLWPSMSLLV